MESIDKGHNILNLQYFHDSNQPGSCGYCKKDGEKKKTSYSVGFSTEEITPEMYEKMMFLGWRRCGDYLYKPNLNKSCCKLYTLRLDIDRFTINKNQRKVMKNFRKYLAGEEIKKTNISEDMEMNICEEDQNVVDIYELGIHKFSSSFINSEILLQNLNIDKIPTDLEHKVYLNKNVKLGDYSSNLFIVLYHRLLKSIEDFKSKFTDPKNFYTYMYNLLLEFKSHYSSDFMNYWKIEISIKSGHLNFLSLDPIKEDVLKIRKLLEEKTEKEKKKKDKGKGKGKSIQSGQSVEPVEDSYLLPYFEEYVKEPPLSRII
jgi:arginyl-tRNA--protein-N-Asp/Glu arginylyltransferase